MKSETVSVPVMTWDAEKQVAVDTGNTREQLEVGTAVKVTDEVGKIHIGLVTAVHGPNCINVVYVTGDGAKRDPYGNQIERLSSLQKQTDGLTAHGRYYEHI